MEFNVVNGDILAGAYRYILEHVPGTSCAVVCAGKRGAVLLQSRALYTVTAEYFQSRPHGYIATTMTTPEQGTAPTTNSHRDTRLMASDSFHCQSNCWLQSMFHPQPPVTGLAPAAGLPHYAPTLGGAPLPSASGSTRTMYRHNLKGWRSVYSQFMLSWLWL